MYQLTKNNLIYDLHNALNTASTQDTANTHTNKMGDFIDPLFFSRALPPNYSPHRMGFNGPPRGRYGVILPQYRVKWPKVGVM